MDSAPSTDLPHAPDAESAILACLIDYPGRFGPIALEAGIVSDYFHLPETRGIFGIIANRLKARKPLDPSSIKEDIRKHKPPGVTLGKLAGILNCEFSTDAWDGYVEALRQTAAKRLLIQSANITDETNGYDAVTAMRKATELAQDILQGSSEIYDAKRASSAFIAALEEMHAAGTSAGEPTGIEWIDNHTGGMRPGELWVVGAKTSGGKSVLMLQMAARMIKEGKRVAIFSLELTVEEVMARIICNLTKVPMDQIMNPRTMCKQSLEIIKARILMLQEQKFAICDMSGLTMDQIAAHCIRLNDTSGLDLVLIDYLQMVSAPRVKGQNREQEVAGISRQCKQLAKRLKTPVLTATQLNDNGQARESRAIEHDADNVLMIVDRKEKDGNYIETVVDFWKCRNGERGVSCTVELNGKLQRFNFYPKNNNTK
jgi:replicative DNA helicase